MGLFVLCCGCSKQETEPQAQKEEKTVTVATTAASTGPAYAVQALNLFKTRCAVCHGEGGHGDGPGAAALNPKPRNYADAEWQKSVTDEQIKNTIVHGGAAVGKSPIMPANPDLNQKPEVVAELVKIVRNFAKR